MEVDWDSDVDDELALQCLYRAEAEKANFKPAAQQAENMVVNWDSDVDDELALQCLYKAERDREDEAEELAVQSVERAESQQYLDCLEAQAIADEVKAKAKAEVDEIEAAAADAKAEAAGIDRDDVAGAVLYARQHPEKARRDRLDKEKARRDQEDEEYERSKKRREEELLRYRWTEYAERMDSYERWIRDMVLANYSLRNQDEDSKVNRDKRLMVIRGCDAKNVKDYVKRKRNERKVYYKELIAKAETATRMLLRTIYGDELNIWNRLPIPPVVTNFKVWKLFGGVFITRKEYGPVRSRYKILQESDSIDMKRATKGLPPLPFHNLDRMMCFAALGDVIALIINEVGYKDLDPFNRKWYEKELYTPLDMAASRGQMEVVEYLTGEKFEQWRWHGQRAIREAAKNGHVEIVSYLARKLHASRDRSSPFNEREIFSYMVEGGSTESVDSLLNRYSRASVMVNRKDGDGNYPIGIAARSGNSEVLFCLFVHGGRVGINSYDGYGRQPIHLAALNGNHLVIEMLVKAGAEFDSPTFLADKSADNQREFGNTPLHFSSEIDCWCVSCSKLLIDKGASMLKRNNVGNTPLHVAVYERSLRTIIYLVQRGADVTIKNKSGVSPSTLATEMLAEAPDDNVWQHICDFFNGVDDSTTNEYRRFPNLLVEV